MAEELTGSIENLAHTACQQHLSPTTQKQERHLFSCDPHDTHSPVLV